jgi:hypothetical protein
LEFLTNDRVDSPSGQQKIEPINEEKPVLKSEIQKTTTANVIQINTSQVKLNKEFDGPVFIEEQVDAVMEDVALDCGEEKTDKVVDSKYLQPRWCPPGLTRTQKHKLKCLWLVVMREKRRDKFFNKIKTVTPPKQEWRRKEAPRGSTAELAVGGQTAAPVGPITANLVSYDPTSPFGGKTA